LRAFLRGVVNLGRLASDRACIRHLPGDAVMIRFRTRLLAAAGVTAFLFAVAMLAAMQSADSQPMAAAKSAPSGPPVACTPAPPVEQALQWADAGYYQAEYAARRRCGPAIQAQ
jgi:hypothetical protein